MIAFCPQHHELNTEHSKPEVDNENSLLRLDSTLNGTILIMQRGNRSRAASSDDMRLGLEILELTIVRTAAICPQRHELNTEHSKPEVDNENSLLRLDSTLNGTILIMQRGNRSRAASSNGIRLGLKTLLFT